VARSRAVPWWTPLLGLLLLAGVVVAVALDRGGDSAEVASPAATTTTRSTTAPPAAAGGVAGVHITRTAPRRAHTELEVGMRAAEHSVRVLDVAGDRIFWIGTDKATRRLVHLQGAGTRWGIRRGQRLTFTAVVARNRPGAAARWGLTRREGRDQLDRQGTHFEVFGPRIRFLCVTRCT
jgi:hypothetical protein